VEETYTLREEVKKNKIVFQLGHQGRQTESYFKAREAIQKNLLGKISLIEVTTNRNTPNGAWVYPIHPDASPENIDWKQFIGQAPWHDFSLERFFRWRCWWDYSTGLSGDLLTHEYDAMNQILNLGIPKYASSSGGIYYFKDGRTVPDVLQTVFEFPDKDLSMLYSASLASSKKRGKVIMGHDANMELGQTLTIMADRNSTRYADKIKDKVIDLSRPIYSYIPGRKNVDAVSSATEQYFAGRGLLYTYRNGRRVDTTHLHIKEWLEAIRTGGKTSCNIDRGFEEAITAHMGTIAYREGRRTEWDADNEKII
jgi:predicted dehydrogenase